MAGVTPGDQTIVYGAGPVGLMASYSAILKGAGRVWVADHQPDRLRLAEEIGAIAINTAEQDPAEVVKEATLGLGADNGCACVGYQAHDPQGQEDATLTMNGSSTRSGSLVVSVCDLIAGGKAEPGFLVSHELSSTRPHRRTSTSTTVTTAGPRSSSTRRQQS